jgi:hypothetical protein
MPGPQLQTAALVLGRQPSGSDSFEQLLAFSEQEGVLLCLRRISTKAASATPPLDLFDEAELWLESSNQGRTWFIKEHRHLTRRPGLGRSYAALQVAAQLARLVQHNPIPDESRPSIGALLRQTLASLEAGARPDLVWFKALFCFLRDEGYPVKQQWWQQLGSTERDTATQMLNQPIAQQNPEPALVARLTQRLQDWIAGDTEIRLK